MAEIAPVPGRPQTTNATLADLSPQETQRFWTAEIACSREYFRNWWDTCDRIYERYRDERGRNDGTGHRTTEGGRIQTKRFNILWSNVSTLFPALYNDPPEPMVSRRYKDEDPLGRLAVELSERSLQYIQDPDEEECSFDAAARCAVLDYLLVGRGVTWVRYEREVEETVEESKITDEAGQPVMQETVIGEEVASEKLRHDNVRYRDFIHSINPTWDEVLKRGWIGRRLYMTKPEVAEQYGKEAAEKIQLTAADTASGDGRPTRDGNEKKGQQPKYAEIWELWNVPDRKRYDISISMQEPLKVQDDPLKLRDFFPLKRPLYATTTPDTLIPVPDYVLYYDQAENLDRITDKIWKLTTALRVAGLYAGQEAQQLQQLFDGTDRNVMIPVQDWAHIQDKGGVDGLISWVPLDLIVKALLSLYEAAEFNKQQIYEITGVADIIRGQSKANETLGAQRIKGQWASVRLADRQSQVAKYLRGVLRTDAEIIAEHYDATTIADMTNFANSAFAQNPVYVRAFMQAVELLRDDKMRTFRVDVETRDTVFADEMQERQQNLELLTAMGQFLQSAAEIGAALPESVPVLGEMMKVGMRSFSGSQARQLEMAVEQMVAQLEDRTAQAAENPQPDPEAEAALAEATVKTQELQLKARELALKEQMAQQELALKGQEVQFKGQEVGIKAFDAETDRMGTLAKTETDRALGVSKAETDRINALGKVETDRAKLVNDREKQLLQSMGGNGNGAGEPAADGGEEIETGLGQVIQAMVTASEQMARAADSIAKAAASPKRIVRDDTGRVAGVETLQ